MDIEKFYSTVIGSTINPQRTAFFLMKMDLSPLNVLRSPLNVDYTDDMRDANQLLQQGLVCSNVQLPSREFQTSDLTIYGVEEKYPILSTFVDFTCEFYTPLRPHRNGYRNKVSAALHHWQDAIQPLQQSSRDLAYIESPPEITGLNFKFPDAYRLAQGVRVEQYSSSESTMSEVETLSVDPGTDTSNRRRRIFRTAISAGDIFKKQPTLVYYFYNVYPIRVDSSALDWSDVDQFERVRVSFAFTHWTVKKIRSTPDPLPVQTAAESAQFTTSVPGIPKSTLTPPPPQGSVQDPE